MYMSAFNKNRVQVEVILYTPLYIDLNPNHAPTVH